MHYIRVQGILNPKTNNLNIYRGCTHGCIYCDSRSKCYNLDHDFNDIAVKENVLELLEQELSKKRKKIVILTGSMSDPYMPIEKELMLTRKALEIIYKYGNGINIQTKSDLVLRDLDLLKKINKQTKATVSMTLTTSDEELCEILEPNVTTTKNRVDTLKILAENGIDTYVWISPILPFINDSLDNLRALLNYCKEARVKGIFWYGAGLTLRDGNREYFYQKLDEFFPKMKKKYQNTFKNNYYCPSPYEKYLFDYLKRFCNKENIKLGNDELYDEIKTISDYTSYEQISLFNDI